MIDVLGDDDPAMPLGNSAKLPELVLRGLGIGGYAGIQGNTFRLGHRSLPGGVDRTVIISIKPTANN
jgi:hypothetical protein